MSDSDRIECLNPDPTKTGTRIPRWKYDAVRRAILTDVAAHPEGAPFAGMAGRVGDRLSASELERLGSVSWHTTVVKLDLEARGEIERVPGVRPQRIRRVGG